MKRNKINILIVLLCFTTLLLAACNNETKESNSNDFTDCEIFMSQDLLVNCIDNTDIDAIFINSHDLTVLNIWATYCSPCIEEMPVLEKLANEDPDNLAIIGLVSDVYNMDGTINEKQLELAESIINKVGLTYPVLLANDQIREKLLSLIQAVPTTLFIDSNGKVVGSKVGSMDEDTWRKTISEYKIAK